MGGTGTNERSRTREAGRGTPGAVEDDRGQPVVSPRQPAQTVQAQPAAPWRASDLPLAVGFVVALLLPQLAAIALMATAPVVAGRRVAVYALMGLLVLYLAYALWSRFGFQRRGVPCVGTVETVTGWTLLRGGYLARRAAVIAYTGPDGEAYRVRAQSPHATEPGQQVGVVCHRRRPSRALPLLAGRDVVRMWLRERTVSVVGALYLLVGLEFVTLAVLPMSGLGRLDLGGTTWTTTNLEIQRATSFFASPVCEPGTAMTVTFAEDSSVSYHSDCVGSTLASNSTWSTNRGSATVTFDVGANVCEFTPDGLRALRATCETPAGVRTVSRWTPA